MTMPFKNPITSRKAALGVAAACIGLTALLWMGWLMLGPKSTDGAEQPDRIPTYESEPQAVRLTEAMSTAIDEVFTSQKQMAMTFNGLADRETMARLLVELAEYDIRATFFLPGMRVAEEPDLAAMIVEAGHEIGNNTLDHADMSEWSAAQIVEDLQLSNEIVERETGVRPRYVRTRSGDYSDELRRAAEALGLDAVVGYSINPRDRDMQSAAEIGAYVDRYMRRGAVLLLNTHLNPEVVGSIAPIAEAAKRKGYAIVPLGELVDGGALRKPLEEIPGYDAARMNPDYADSAYTYIESLPNGEKKIALTFDDWGSEGTINTILEILDAYEVKCTFFLVGEGVERNPNLARAILDAGHEIANHSYSHKVVTTLTPEELQEEVVKGHQAITNAIQEQPLMFFRPPTGEIDEISSRIIAATGYEMIVNYDVTALDWDEDHSAEDITNTIMERTVDGSIILLHILDNIHTPEALPHVLEGLLDKGYSFVKVTELLSYARE